MKKTLIALLALALMLTPATLATTSEDALSTARSLVGEAAQLTESERDDGLYEYDFRDETARYSVDILASDGSVLQFETEYKDIPRAKDFTLTETDAANAITALDPDATLLLTVSERDDDDGATYEIFFSTETELAAATVNAETGEIRRIERYPAAIAQGILTPDAIAALVLDRQPDDVIKDLELNIEDGRYEYEGEIGRYSFEIDALTGDFFDWEIDD